MSNDVHFLGEYASINDVWKLYPNGGNFGDYILIGEEYIYWNEYTRSWGEQSELEGTVRPSETIDHDIHVLGKGTFDYGVSFGDYIPGESGADIDGSGNGELRTIKIDNAFIKDPISGQYIVLSDYIKKFKTELPPNWDEYSKSILFDDVRILVFDAASNNKYYTTVGDLKKLISDSIGETGGGGGETGTIEVVRSDNPDAILTDNNVLSSLRTLQEISRLENSSHSHSNKDILDKLSQSDLDVLSKLRLVNGKLEIGTDAYSVGEISAFGVGDGTGGGGGVSSLDDLVDVILTSPQIGDILMNTGTHWENKPQSEIVPDLSGYATTEYVDNKVADVDSDKTFRFSQTTPQSVWVVTHNLRKYPSVTVIDSAGTEVIGEVEYIDINTVSIKFAYEFSGYVLCN